MLEFIAERDPPSSPTIIEELIEANADVWELYLNNQFCAVGYRASAAEFDSTYRDFAKQCYLYLVEYARFSAIRGLQDPATHTQAGMKNLTDELPHKLRHAEKLFNKCIDKMGINAEDLRNERLSQAISGYTAWLELNAMRDDVFSNYVRMIPCIWGWHQIACHLNRQGPGENNSLFYNHWFEESMRSQPARKLSAYLEANRGDYECWANWKKWSAGFRQACLFEIAFFDAAFRRDLVT